ncbi:MAG: hypothetical protein ACN6P5_19850 [Pseudomonas protegens]
MGITVTNGASGTVNVSISTWKKEDKDGSDDYFQINQGSNESWKRSDSRGYLMAVKINAKINEYYISANSKIVVEDNLVKDQGQTLTPLVLENNM